MVLSVQRRFNMERKILSILIVVFCGLTLFAEDYFLSRSDVAKIAIGLKAYVAYSEQESVQVKDYLRRLQISVDTVSNSKKTEIIKVNTFNDYMNRLKNEETFIENYLEHLSIEELIPLTGKVRFVSDNINVQRKIDQYELRRKDFLNSKVQLAFTILLKSLYQKVDTLYTNAQTKLQTESLLNSKVDDLLKDLNPTGSVEVSVLIQLLKKYYKYLPKFQKAEILYQLSKQPINSNKMDLFLILIQNSGPQFQKTIQILARKDEIPEDFRSIAEKLESQVKQVPWKIVRNLLLKNNVDINLFKYFEHKPLGVGTMAQTHRIQYLVAPDKRVDMVMRFLKPNIEKMLEMDNQILLRIADEIDADPELKKYNLPSLKGFVIDANKSVKEELVMTDTERNQLMGKSIYSRNIPISFNGQRNILRIQIPYVSFYQNNPELMVQQLVFGRKPSKEFSKYKDIYPDLYKITAEQIAKMWLDEAFFKSGFFHADMHQGNIMAELSDHEIVLNILDFGMVGQLSEKVKKSAILLGIAINVKNVKMIAKHFMNLQKINENTQSLDQIEELIKGRMKVLNGKDNSLENWTAWVASKGLEFDYEFLKLNRGLAAIDVLLKDSKSPLGIQSLIIKTALENKIYLAKIIYADKDFTRADLKELVRIGLIRSTDKNSSDVSTDASTETNTSKVEDSKKTASKAIMCKSLF